MSPISIGEDSLFMCSLGLLFVTQRRKDQMERMDIRYMIFADFSLNKVVSRFSPFTEHISL